MRKKNKRWKVFMNISGNLVVDLGIDVKEVYGFVDLEGKGKY